MRRMTSASRRWNQKPRRTITISDAAVWALVTLVVGVSLIVVCVLLTLGAPA